MRRILCILLFAAHIAAPLAVQAQEDDKVRLISAKQAQLIERDGQSYRKVVGPAKFFHNNTYLLCDTALWNVNTNIIDAVGHVSIIQDRTRLSSETLQYVVDDNMARFRGKLVQLEDDEKNTLRTRYLDYNTKDSVAIFQNGAAMRDKDGQVIESRYGTYDSKAHLFVFNENVNMYMDTTFVKTSRLEYRSDLSTAYFGYGTDMWQDDKMLSANDGWYRRPDELFFFRRNVHLLTENQEAWSDTMYYHRLVNNVQMLGKVEIMDSTKNVYALAGRFDYTDSLSMVEMSREPAIMSVTKEKGRRDSIYVGADFLRYRTVKMCDIPDESKANAKKRIENISGDPIMDYRRIAAEEAAKAQAQAAAKNPNTPPSALKLKDDTRPESPRTASSDSLAATATAADTTTTPSDTLPPPPDTTKVTYLWGSSRVKLFRKDMQMSSDSLLYCDLDSLVRLYKDPVFFNEGNRQYAADSIYMVIHNKAVERAHLLSNAFITIEEEPSSAYDQIRGTEMVAYFDSTSALTRFDALGGASSVFYLVENGALATVNKVDSKMIYATFKDGDIEKMYYYDSPSNDAYPSVQLPGDERRLKGFRWEPEKRPTSPRDITSLRTRPSQRTSYLSHPHANFQETDIYFPGYIGKVYRDIAIRDSLKVVREREKAAAGAPKDIPQAEKADTTASSPTSPSVPSSPTTSVPKDTARISASDTAAPSDTAQVRQPTAKEIRKAQRQAAREARWAEQDRRYEARQKARQEKRLKAERAAKLRALRRLEKKSAKEKKLLDKYIRKERAKALRRSKQKRK